MAAGDNRELRDELTCQAGRMASKGGAWTVPCPQVATNVLGFGDSNGAQIPVELRFCHDHMQELIADGLVAEPYMDPAEFERRRRK